MKHRPHPTHPWRQLGVLLGISAAMGSAQAYLIDTGIPTAGSADYLLTNDGASFLQNLGGGFSLTGNHTVTAVDGWIQTLIGGVVTVSLWSGAPSTSSAPLFSTTASLPGTGVYGWASASGLNWAVGPGNYSVTFTPSVGYDGNMAGFDYDTGTGGAPNPLPSYYSLSDALGWQAEPGLNLGIRVDGVAVAVPEPGASALMLIGLTAMALAITTRRRSR